MKGYVFGWLSKINHMKIFSCQKRYCQEVILSNMVVIISVLPCFHLILLTISPYFFVQSFVLVSFHAIISHFDSIFSFQSFFRAHFVVTNGILSPMFRITQLILRMIHVRWTLIHTNVAQNHT